MQFREVVRRRRMFRDFERRELTRQQVQLVLDHAQRAPSAGFAQGWAFVVLEGYEQTESYWQSVGPGEGENFPWPRLANAPLLVICLVNKAAYLERYAEPDKGWSDRDERRWLAPYWYVDAGMSILLMLLTATDENLGALFFAPPRSKLETLRSKYAIPTEYEVIGVVAVGYPLPSRLTQSVQRGHKPAATMIHRGQWHSEGITREGSGCD